MRVPHSGVKRWHISIVHINVYPRCLQSSFVNSRTQFRARAPFPHKGKKLIVPLKWRTTAV